MLSDREETVGDVPETLSVTATTTAPEASISEVIRLLKQNPRSRMVYVVDAKQRLLGTVSWRCVLRVAKARLGARKPGVVSLVRLLRDLMPETARDLMRSPTPVHRETPIRDAFLLMEETKQNDLPIVDDQGRLVGELNGMHVMDVALRVFEQTEADLSRARQAKDSP